MNAALPLTVALVVGPVAAYAVVGSQAREAEARSQAAAARAQADDTGAAIEAQIAALEARVEQLGQTAERRARPARRTAVNGLELAIQAELEALGVQLDPAALERASEARAAARSERLARIDALLAAGDHRALTDGFEALGEPGAVDEVLAALQARSDADPANVEAAEELGLAYEAALNTTGYGPRAAGLAEDAEGAFQRALEADPERDDLRLRRAFVLARTPSFLGRRGEAIEELETLVQRGDAGGSVDPRAYSTLGTLLLEQGQKQRALEAWQRGAGAFPDDEALRELLRLHDQ